MILLKPAKGVLLIAPEGIEIVLCTTLSFENYLLIAPEGIEIKYLFVDVSTASDF